MNLSHKENLLKLAYEKTKLLEKIPKVRFTREYICVYIMPYDLIAPTSKANFWTHLSGDKSPILQRPLCLGR